MGGGGSGGVSSFAKQGSTALTGAVTLSEGSNITLTQVGQNIAIASTAGGTGTVTSVSVVSANGISGTVATPTTTPAITLVLGSITPSSVQVSGLTASQLLSTDASKNLTSLDIATYPSLTELSYVKGVTSAIQTQLNSKGSGTVTAVSIVSANGISGSSSGGATPALTIALGVITPTSVNGLTLHAAVDGWDITGGTTARKLTVTGADITLTGSGINVFTFPSATDTLVGRASTDTLTNKTFDTAGAGNVFKINGTAISAVSGTGSVALTTSPVFTTPNIGSATGNISGSAATVTGAAQTAITSVGTLTGLTMGGTLAMGVNSITMTGSIAATGARVTKGWFTDIESTNMPTVGGTSLSSTFAAIGQTTYVGTTAIALNRSSAAQSLTGITSIDGSAATLTTARTINGVSFNGSANVIVGPATDGWVDATAETWTYASASTFTVSGDKTAQYTVGTRLKFTQTTVKYAIVVSSSYSNPNTTVTIAVNTDYTIANAAISANYYSYLVNPQGYPGWFALAAPTFDVTYYDNASGGQPTTSEFRINITGRIVHLHYRGNGTKAGTNPYIVITAWTAPTPANSTVLSQLGSCYFSDTNQGGFFYSANPYIGVATANMTDNTTIANFTFNAMYEI